MKKENVHIKEIAAYNGLNTWETTLNFNFEEKENNGMGLQLQVGMEPSMVANIKRVFDVKFLTDLKGREITLVKKDGDHKIVALGVDGEKYLYKKGEKPSRILEEKDLETEIEKADEKKSKDYYDFEK